MREKPPNILMIISDEHDPGVTGCYGDSKVRTPHLDRLAAEGVVFDQCYTTSPLCVPARLSFTAGKYVSRCGAWSNTCRLPSADYPSLPRILRDADYEPYLCGKMHYDRNRRYGFNDLIPDDRENSARKTGRGARTNPTATERNPRSWEKRTSQFHIGEEHESIVMRDDRVRTREACKFLRERDASDKPFFLSLGYLSPHFPLIVPEQYHDMYKDRISMPDMPSDWFERLPTNYQQLIINFGVDREDREIVKLGRELYWGLVTWMDNEIGKVLKALRSSAVADNTIVIYTSDHGENKGDHGMWWKNNMFEHSARIPLVFNYPKRWSPGERRSEICSLVDLTQTIADLAHAQTPDDWNGDSMVELLDAPGCQWKDIAVSEYYGHNISSGFAMLRQGDYKYVYHTRINEEHDAERELYNLSDDPGEWNNLAGHAEQASRIRHMHELLVRELGRDPEEAEAECRRDSAEGYETDN